MKKKQPEPESDIEIEIPSMFLQPGEAKQITEAVSKAKDTESNKDAIAAAAKTVQVLGASPVPVVEAHEALIKIGFRPLSDNPETYGGLELARAGDIVMAKAGPIGQCIIRLIEPHEVGIPQNMNVNLAAIGRIYTIRPIPKPTCKTYLLKAVCATDKDCVAKGYTVRVTNRWVNKFGAPLCPKCSSPMSLPAKATNG